MNPAWKILKPFAHIFVYRLITFSAFQNSTPIRNEKSKDSHWESFLISIVGATIGRPPQKFCPIAFAFGEFVASCRTDEQCLLLRI